MHVFTSQANCVFIQYITYMVSRDEVDMWIVSSSGCVMAAARLAVQLRNVDNSSGCYRAARAASAGRSWAPGMAIAVGTGYKVRNYCCLLYAHAHAHKLYNWFRGRSACFAVALELSQAGLWRSRLRPPLLTRAGRCHSTIPPPLNQGPNNSRSEGTCTCTTR